MYRKTVSVNLSEVEKAIQDGVFENNEMYQFKKIALVTLITLQVFFLLFWFSGTFFREWSVAFNGVSQLLSLFTSSKVAGFNFAAFLTITLIELVWFKLKDVRLGYS